MLFCLVVRKLVYLQSILEGCLGCLCLVIEIHKTLTFMAWWERLLYISVCEVDNRVSIWPLLSSNTVVEYNFFSAILIKLVNFTILASDFLHHYILIFFLRMIRRLELKFILIFCFSYPRLIIFLRVNTHHHFILLFRNAIVNLSSEFFDCR